MNYVTSAVEPKTKHKVHSCFVYINFACICMCAHVCVSCVCMGVQVCGECIWRPEDNLGCHPQEFTSFEIGTLSGLDLPNCARLAHQ